MVREGQVWGPEIVVSRDRGLTDDCIDVAVRRNDCFNFVIRQSVNDCHLLTGYSMSLVAMSTTLFDSSR